MNNLNVTNLKSINAAKYDNEEFVTRDLNIHSDLILHLPPAIKTFAEYLRFRKQKLKGFSQILT